jgi:hypothetical protein
MVRTQIYLTEEEQSRLRLLSRRSGQRQSALIREALDDYLARAAATPRPDRLQACRGMWRDRDLAEFQAVRRGIEQRLAQ